MTSGTVDQKGTGTVSETTDVFTIVQATEVPVDQAPSDIVFHLQFKNPVSSETPAYDGLYAVAVTSIAYDGTNAPTISLAWDQEGTVIADLAPTGDYDTTLDATIESSDGAGDAPVCVSQ